EPERHRGEILRGKTFAGPEIGVGRVHLDRARAHGVEALKRWDQLARTEVLNFQAATRHLLDALGEIVGAARTGRIEGCTRRVRVGHAPAERLLSADDGRSGDCGSCTSDEPGLEKGTTLHGLLPGFSFLLGRSGLPRRSRFDSAFAAPNLTGHRAR